MLGFTFPKGKVRAIWVTPGMPIDDETEEWKMDNANLSVLTVAQLKTIVEKGGFRATFPLKKGYVDFIAKKWDDILNHVQLKYDREHPQKQDIPRSSTDIDIKENQTNVKDGSEKVEQDIPRSSTDIKENQTDVKDGSESEQSEKSDAMPVSQGDASAPEWTSEDQKNLDFLQGINSKGAVKIDSDIQWMLEKKKAKYETYMLEKDHGNDADSGSGGESDVPFALNEQTDDLNIRGVIEVKNSCVAKHLNIMHFFYSEQTVFNDLIDLFSEKLDIDVGVGGDFAIQWRGNSPITNAPWESIKSWTAGSDEGDVFTLDVHVLGGGLFRQTQKTYLKKADAVADMKRKFVKVLVKTEVPDGQPLNDEFIRFITGYENMIAQAKMLKASGQNIFQLAINRLSTDELKLVKEMMNEKGGRKTTEDKLVKIAQFVYPPLQSLDQASKSLTKLHEEITAEICGFYSDEFSVFANGNIRLDNRAFEAEIDKELLKRQLESEQSAGYNPPAGGNSCVLC
eukprot:s2869_g15.t1